MHPADHRRRMIEINLRTARRSASMASFARFIVSTSCASYARRHSSNSLANLRARLASPSFVPIASLPSFTTGKPAISCAKPGQSTRCARVNGVFCGSLGEPPEAASRRVVPVAGWPAASATGRLPEAGPRLARRGHFGLRQEALRDRWELISGHGGRWATPQRQNCPCRPPCEGAENPLGIVRTQGTQPWR
ncbi:hypothetical protein GGD65_008078 [Bradyrhizobium sp. CIR18]|nr:hypothetical protein [Bradyrhizobium sp. CIR18]